MSNLILSVIIILAMCGLFALIGFIVGLVKGFTRVNTWGGEYVLTAFSTILLGKVLKLSPEIYGIVVLAVSLVLFLLFIGLSALVKKLLNRSMEKRDDDMRKYGAVGVFNRIFGGISLLCKGAVIAFTSAAFILFLLDLSQIQTLAATLGFDKPIWASMRPWIADLLLIGLVQLAVRQGFASGISSALWKLLTVGLVVGAGFIAYNLVFNLTVFDGATQSLSGMVNGWVASIPNAAQFAPTIAKWILTAVIFLILAILVLVVSMLVSRVLTFARAGSAFYIADGILGGIVVCIITLAALMVVGFILQPIYDLDFMQAFTNYFTGSSFAKIFYTENLLANFGIQPFIPIRDWFTS